MANDKFGKRGTFKCDECGKLTRETGVNSSTDYCPECYIKLEEENKEVE